MSGEKRHRPDPLKPGTEQFIKRQARHKHNGFRGTVALCKGGMMGILQASTTTPEAKELAEIICLRLEDLAEALKKRVD